MDIRFLVIRPLVIYQKVFLRDTPLVILDLMTPVLSFYYMRKPSKWAVRQTHTEYYIEDASKVPERCCPRIVIRVIYSQISKGAKPKNALL